MEISTNVSREANNTFTQHYSENRCTTIFEEIKKSCCHDVIFLIGFLSHFVRFPYSKKLYLKKEDILKMFIYS